MNSTFILVVGALVLILGLLVFIIWRSAQQAAERRQQLAEMGFTPLNADAALTDKIAGLYQLRGETKSLYELRQAARRTLPDGEQYLFDLFEVSNTDTGWQATQTVAMTAPRLHLPHFVLTPKSDQGNWASALADRAIAWTATRYGKPVPFPEHPEFEQRYTVTSEAPEDARRFLSGNVLRQLSETRFYSIHARGDVFTFTEIGPQSGTAYLAPEALKERVERATELFRLLAARSEPALS